MDDVSVDRSLDGGCGLGRDAGWSRRRMPLFLRVSIFWWVGGCRDVVFTCSKLPFVYKTLAVSCRPLF